jgi:hypothetical protein
MARDAGSGMNVRSNNGMDERDVCDNVTRAAAQVGLKVPACLGACWGAGSKPGVPPLAARGVAHAANKLLQNFCSVVMVALHEIAEVVAD